MWDCFSLPDINELFRYAKEFAEASTSTLTHGLNLEYFLDEIVKKELLNTLTISLEGITEIFLGNIYAEKLIDIIESNNFKKVEYDLYNDNPPKNCQVCMNYKNNFSSAAYNGK